jgi:acyl-CoA thioester hydrolase
MPPSPPPLSTFPFRAHDKLRYADTDRQGHVNNAVFATLLETGRVELLYAADGPLHEAACSFVIASLQLDFHGELTWPGRVEIGTRVASVGRSSVTLEQGLFQDGRCAATARTVIVQVNDATRRSQPLGEAALRRLASHLPP